MKESLLEDLNNIVNSLSNLSINADRLRDTADKENLSDMGKDIHLIRLGLASIQGYVNQMTYLINRDEKTVDGLSMGFADEKAVITEVSAHIVDMEVKS